MNPLSPINTETMYSLLQILSITIALFFPILYILRKYKHINQSNPPPQVKNPWPIIGHLHLFKDSKKPIHLALGEMAENYGPIFTLQLGYHQTVVISSKETAKECFTKADQAVASRPKMLASEHLGYNYAMFGIAPNGHLWRELRKVSMTELLCNHKVQLFRKFRESEVHASINELYKVWRKDGCGEIVVVKMNQWFFDLALNVITRMVNRTRYCTMDPVNDEARRLQKGMLVLFHMFGVFVVADYLPFLRWFDLGGHERKMRSCKQELDGIIQRIVDERRCRQGMESDDRDFMDMLFSVVDGGDLGGYYADDVIKATLLDIFGGSDTITVTLQWALSLLLNNREVLKKAQDELDLKVGKQRQVKESDIPNLIYIQAIVKETMRMYPAAPLAAAHLTTQTCSIGGYTIPEGTRLFVNLHKIHHDPKTWGSPFEFRPDRFLEGEKEIDVKGSQGFELFPFGAGRRKCPGASLAVAVVHLALASLVHGFEMSTPGDARVEMSPSSGLTNSMAASLDVAVAPRLSFDCYK